LERPLPEPPRLGGELDGREEDDEEEGRLLELDDGLELELGLGDEEEGR